MTESAVLDELISLVKSLGKVLCLVHSKYGGELFVSEFFAKLDALDLTDKDLRSLGNCYACKLCNSCCFLTNDLCVERAVYDDSLANLLSLDGVKGIPAALFMMISRILIKNHMQSGEDPAEALFKVNNQLLENNEADLFVTVWLAKVELSTGKVLVSNAGHEYPVVKRADGRFEIIKYRHSPPVSTIRNMKFEQHEAQIGSGDCIFVYTDGVAEATNSSNELFGTDRLITCLNSRSNTNPENILERVMKSINGFVMEAEQFDDITMLCFKYTGADDKEDNN